jgi:DNA-binding CsgD family transcriptional regulator
MDANHPINRLTEREKEVLRAWLNHKSAKEIALDFGITHHAVEKRLKMARTKLDAGSSLEAARMLAEAEGASAGYGQAVTAAPDLPPAPPPRSLLRYRPIAIGGIAMSLALVLALALTTGGTPSAADEDLAAATAAASAAAGASANADKPARAAVIKLDPDMTPVFDKLDENASGYLERPESPFVAMAILDSTQQDGPETSAILGDKTDPEQVARFYAEADTDGDGRVSFREFHVWNSAQLAALGIDTSLELKITPSPQS